MTVRRWEWNERKPRADELAKLAEALGTTTDYLLNGEPEQSEPQKNPGENLPINNAPESVNEDDADLGFWGSVAERAKRVAHSDDSRKPLIAALLNSAVNEFTGSESSNISPAGVIFYGVQENNKHIGDNYMKEAKIKS